MDNGLKVLIAAACVVIIAAGAYFGWTQYREAQVTAAQTANSDRQAACRGSLTKAGAPLQALRDECRKAGLISDEEYYRANSGQFTD